MGTPSNAICGWMQAIGGPKRMRACIGTLLVCGVLVGCAQTRSPIAIADGRLGPPSADVSKWEASLAVKQAIASARSHWSADEPGYDEAVHVMAAATGAFTRPDVEQHAVFYSMSNVPRGFPKRGLAILEGEQLVHNFAFVSLYDDVWALPDIDGDGHDELVFGGGFGMGGQMTSGVTLAAPGEAGLRDLWTAEIFNSACDAQAGYEGSTSARITVVPGSPIMVQHFSQESCESESWQPRGEPEPLTLIPPGESSYVDLLQPRLPDAR